MSKTGPPWAFIKGWRVADVAVFWAPRFWLATEKITTGAVQILQRPIRWFIANQHALITNRTSTQLDMFSPDLLIKLRQITNLLHKLKLLENSGPVVMPWGVPKATFESTRVSKTCVGLTRAASQFEMIWRKRSGSDSLNPICWVQLCWTLKWHLEIRSNSNLVKLGTLIFTPPIGDKLRAHVLRGASYAVSKTEDGAMKMQTLSRPERNRSDKLSKVKGLSFSFSASGWLVIYQLGTAECLQNHGYLALHM